MVEKASIKGKKTYFHKHSTSFVDNVLWLTRFEIYNLKKITFLEIIFAGYSSINGLSLLFVGPCISPKKKIDQHKKNADKQ